MKFILSDFYKELNLSSLAHEFQTVQQPSAANSRCFHPAIPVMSDKLFVVSHLLRVCGIHLVMKTRSGEFPLLRVFA